MFRGLHRLLVVAWWIALSVLAFYLYQYRRAFDPLVDLARSLRLSEGRRQDGRGELSGTAVRVFSGDTFQLLGAGGHTYTVRLTGLSAPSPHSPVAAERRQAAQSRSNLSELIRSQPVRVTVTLSNEGRVVLGLVRSGPTNVNARMVQSGAAVARREFMRGLPWKDRYALIRAERLAAESAASGEAGGELVDLQPRR